MATYQISRRTVLVGAAGSLALAGLGVAVARRLAAPSLHFAPLDFPAGFRRLADDAMGGLSPLAGLERDGASFETPGDICEALFGAVPDGKVPVASFSDYNCPFCKVLTKRLVALEGGLDLAIRWHELPILSPGSVEAARGALAAARQGRYAEFHDRLMRTSFRPNESYLRDMAQALDMDADLLIADMNDNSVGDELRQSRSLARLFGIVGTPALVVGRTLLQGAVDESTLRRLVAAERAEGPPPCA